MSSIDKLKRLTGESNKPPEKPLPQRTEIAELRRRIDAIMVKGREKSRETADRENNPRCDNLQEFVSGEIIENNHGRFFLVSDQLHTSSRHGYRNIRETFGFDMAAAAILANNLAISKFNCADALFLDTETTGLAGGTGTMAFLIGLGWFADGCFYVQQLLARDFSEETAALAYLMEVAAQKKFLITFNGKAFDVNLLNTRFIMSRLRGNLADLPHLDLLHPSRRILGHRLDNSRLCTLEAEVLGVEREGDIPGWEIPQRYFDWLRKRDGRLLAAIFEHNRLDVISMATLTAHLTEIISGAEMSPKATPTDYMAAARLLLRRRERNSAAKALKTVAAGDCRTLSPAAKKEFSLLCKRSGLWPDAACIWENILESSPADFFALEELAKWLEHRVHDCRRAQQIVESALQSNNNFSAEEKESLLHRLKRLTAKK